MTAASYWLPAEAWTIGAANKVLPTSPGQAWFDVARMLPDVAPSEGSGWNEPGPMEWKSS